MKSTAVFSLLALLLPFAATAQSAGVITYESSERIDPSRMKIVIQGGAPADMPPPPENIVRERTVTFSGAAAKMAMAPFRMITREIGNSGVPREKEQNMPPMERPFEMNTFYDLKNRNRIDFLTLKGENGAKEAYFAETPFGDVQLDMTGKTKKILDYTCQKATAKWKDESYTLWITTDVDVTFSPIAELTPAKGLVLEIEGLDKAFRATKVELKAVSPSEVLMPGGGKKVTKEELEAKRHTAMQNFKPFGGK